MHIKQKKKYLNNFPQDMKLDMKYLKWSGWRFKQTAKNKKKKQLHPSFINKLVKPLHKKSNQISVDVEKPGKKNYSKILQNSQYFQLNEDNKETLLFFFLLL